MLHLDSFRASISRMCPKPSGRPRGGYFGSGISHIDERQLLLHFMLFWHPGFVGMPYFLIVGETWVDFICISFLGQDRDNRSIRRGRFR